MFTVAEISDKLKGVGLKSTSQRIVIYGAISGMKNHPSPEQVYAAIKENNPSISLATVYKGLETMAENGLINKITSATGKLRYDPNIYEHNHLYCTNTDEIIDFHDEELDTLLKEFIARKQIDNFQLKDLKLLVKGEKVDVEREITIR